MVPPSKQTKLWKTKRISAAVFNRSISFLFVLSILLGPMGTGCKRGQKLEEERAKEAAAAKQRAVDQARSDLEGLMATPVRDFSDLEERESILADIKNRNIDDAGVRALIRKVEYFLQQERARLEAEQIPPEPPVDPMADLKNRLGQQFTQIARAGNVNMANASIQQAIGMFSSPSTPVLVVISEENGKKDYDRPTTIEKYLNYIKDQRRNPNQISHIETNGAGKITQLELTKR